MKTVVIGAGISGLTLAYQRMRAGDEVVVLEAGPRAGGLIRSERRDGYLLEFGPNAWVDRDEDWRTLVGALDLGGKVVRSSAAAKRRYLAWGGGLTPVPGSPRGLLTTPLLSAAGKARLLLEPLLARRGDARDESLAEFGERHLGVEALPLLDALQTGIFAGEIRRLSARSCFPEWVEAEQSSRSLLVGMARAAKGRPRSRGLSSFRDGMAEISSAIANRLGENLHLNRPAEVIQRVDGRWRIGSGGTTITADHCVLTCGTEALSPLIRAVDSTASEVAGHIASAPMVVVHLGFERRQVSHPLDGFGFLSGQAEKRSVLGCIFSSAVFADRAPPDHVLLTALMGGMRSPEWVKREDSAILEAVMGDLRELLGIDGAPSFNVITRHPHAIPQYEVGHAQREKEVRDRVRAHPGLHVLGTAFGGVGVLDCVRNASRLAEELGSGLAA